MWIVRGGHIPLIQIRPIEDHSLGRFRKQQVLDYYSYAVRFKVCIERQISDNCRIYVYGSKRGFEYIGQL